MPGGLAIAIASLLLERSLVQFVPGLLALWGGVVIWLARRKPVLSIYKDRLIIRRGNKYEDIWFCNLKSIDIRDEHISIQDVQDKIGIINLLDLDKTSRMLCLRALRSLICPSRLANLESKIVAIQRRERRRVWLLAIVLGAIVVIMIELLWR